MLKKIEINDTEIGNLYLIRFTETSGVFGTINTKELDMLRRALDILTGKNLPGKRNTAALFYKTELSGTIRLEFFEKRHPDRTIKYLLYLNKGNIIREALIDGFPIISIDKGQPDVSISKRWFSIYQDYNNLDDPLINLDVPKEPWPNAILSNILPDLMDPIRGITIIEGSQLLNNDYIGLSNNYLRKLTTLRRDVFEYLKNRIAIPSGVNVKSGHWDEFRNRYIFIQEFAGDQKFEFPEEDMGSGIQAGRVLISIIMGKLLEGLGNNQPTTLILPGDSGPFFHPIIKEDFINLFEVLTDKNNINTSNLCQIFIVRDNGKIFSFPNP